MLRKVTEKTLMPLLPALSWLVTPPHRRDGAPAMATLRYEPEIARPEPPLAPSARLSAIRTKLAPHFRGAAQMLNYQTNARGGALVRFNPVLPSGAEGSRPAPDSARPLFRAAQCDIDPVIAGTM
jgi:hypothetical protein